MFQIVITISNLILHCANYLIFAGTNGLISAIPLNPHYHQSPAGKENKKLGEPSAPSSPSSSGPKHRPKHWLLLHREEGRQIIPGQSLRISSARCCWRSIADSPSPSNKRRYNYMMTWFYLVSYHLLLGWAGHYLGRVLWPMGLVKHIEVPWANLWLFGTFSTL